jgi:hypothetical protein
LTLSTYRPSWDVEPQAPSQPFVAVTWSKEVDRRCGVLNRCAKRRVGTVGSGRNVELGTAARDRNTAEGVQVVDGVGQRAPSRVRQLHPVQSLVVGAQRAPRHYPNRAGLEALHPSVDLWHKANESVRGGLLGNVGAAHGWTVLLTGDRNDGFCGWHLFGALAQTIGAAPRRPVFQRKPGHLVDIRQLRSREMT